MPFAQVLAPLLSLAIGLLCIVLGYQLQRKYPLGFLPAYLAYLTFSVVYGLFNWTGISLISAVFERTKPDSLKAVLVLSILSLPFLILRVTCLFQMVLKWAEARRTRIYWTGYILFGAVLTIMVTVMMLKYFGTGNKQALRLLDWIGPSVLVAQILAFIYGLSARGDPPKKHDELKGLRRFSAIGLVSFAVYVAASYLGPNSDWFRIFMPVLYYLVLLPPLLYLRGDLSKSAPAFPDFRDVRTKLDRLAERFALTPRETEIVGLLIQGKSNKEIAAELFISPHTVKNATSRIYEKVGVRSRGRLAGFLV